MKCICGGSTNVTTTQKHLSGGVFRRRLCSACGKRFATLESVVALKADPAQPKTIYTKTEAAAIHARKVATRRTNEDRRARMAMYYIDDTN